MSNNFTIFDLARQNTALNKNLYGNVVRASNELVVGANRYQAMKTNKFSIKTYQSWLPLSLTMVTNGDGTVINITNRSTYRRLGDAITINLSFNFTPATDGSDDGTVQNFIGLPNPPNPSVVAQYGNVALVTSSAVGNPTQQAQIFINNNLLAVDPLTNITLTQGSGSISYDSPNSYSVAGQITYRP